MEKEKIVNGTLHAIIAFIFNEQDEILMFLREGKEWERGWEPVKGAIHFGETEEQTALREIKEEAGLENIEIAGKIPRYYYSEKPWKNGKIKIKVSVFVCRYLGGKIKLGEEEHVKYKWMKLEEAREKIWISKRILEDACKFYSSLSVK